MAAPRVFVSSTCFDLAEVRDSLISFCQSFGFEVVLSERGDVFYHPDLHTHESCISEVANCQIFILIIGGRFGGRYKVDTSKSISNAEYFAAREAGIPVFTFIKDGVLTDHHVFQKNRNKDFSNQIEYPSLEKQEYAESIFKFIDHVRSSEVNNGFFGFKYARDLHDNLRKQWAAMFFDFLSKRSLSNQLKSTNESISNLSIASKKIEDLIKNIYRQVDIAQADESIKSIDAESEASKFFLTIGNMINDNGFIPSNILEELANSTIENWWEFILQIDNFEYIEDVRTNDDRHTSAVVHTKSNSFIADIEGELTDKEIQERDKLSRYYKYFKKLSPESRKNVMYKYDDIPF